MRKLLLHSLLYECSNENIAWSKRSIVLFLRGNDNTYHSDVIW